MNAIILAIMAGLCWGIGELFTKSVLHSGKIGPITAIAVRSTVALPVLWIVYLVLVQGRKMEPLNWMKSDWTTLLKLICGSGLIAGAGGMICFYASLHLADISRIKPIAFSIAPAIAVVLGWLVLGEHMSWQKFGGVVLIVAGVILLTGGVNTKARTNSPQSTSAGQTSMP
jgi:bacterial/archaeal transporter family protein